MKWFAKHHTDPRRLLGGEGLPDLERLNALGFNTYYHINPSSHAFPLLKGSREHIIAWRHLLIDLDPIGEPVPIELAFDLARETARGAGIMDDLYDIVWSGRGVQLLLRVQLVEAEYRPELIERACMMFLRSIPEPTLWPVKVDTTTYDLARVARVPGSINQRTGRHAEYMGIGSGFLLDPWGILDLAAAAPEPAPSTARVSIPPDINLPRAWLLAHLNHTAIDFIFYGAEYPSRHRAAYVTALALRDLGVDEERATQVVLSGAARCRPRPLDADDAVRQVQSAYNRRRE